jgi:carbonic anhydrase
MIYAPACRPFAVILGCSDSGVPPDVLFDQGIGDLFVIHVAGNVATADALGSIEYAVDHLDAKLIVVTGHRRCGAVRAVFCP